MGERDDGTSSLSMMASSPCGSTMRVGSLMARRDGALSALEALAIVECCAELQ